MGKTTYWILGIIGIIIFACVFVATGFLVGRAASIMGINPFTNSMAVRNSPFSQSELNQQSPFDFFSPRARSGSGWQPRLFGGMGSGMMGGYQATESTGEPITIDQAKQAVQEYMDNLAYKDLEIKEVMIFDNQAYAEVKERSTGNGAMELLVDPFSLNVYPEYGPNMMWNQKYGHMAGTGMMGGMMGDWSWQQGSDSDAKASTEMPVSPQKAIEIAQRYLDVHQPGTSVSDEADQFYGYYTLHTFEGEQVIGMLSVNGYTGQVFPHTWHGKFIEMWEADD